VAARAEETRSLIEAGLNRVREFAHLRDEDIVVCQLDTTNDEIISRYAPFFFFPLARYSIVLLRKKGSAKITAMRNPWIEFQSVPLGKIFEQYGGGGHQRVASVILAGDRSNDAEYIVNDLVSEIEKQETASPSRIQRALA